MLYYLLHKVEVHQYVFFIGEGKAKMKQTIEEDIRFRQGQESGKEETAKETILEMLKGGFIVNDIVKYVKVPREFIEQIAKQFKK